MEDPSTDLNVSYNVWGDEVSKTELLTNGMVFFVLFRVEKSL